uniref:Alpha-tubulin folding cofactor B n=1 Tax=Ustilago esculenta TaxID=185366 RepID=A0A481SHJ5_9BASI|nr:alpha-tubulin folding cofactor B [Ustilago esculenta]
MASTSTQNIPGSSSNNSPALSDPTSHQRSKKKQQCMLGLYYPSPIFMAILADTYTLLCHSFIHHLTDEALLNAEVGTAFTSTSLGSPASHPSFPAVAPLCRQYPTQASAIFQTYLDLKNGAAAWDSVEPLVLSINPQSIPEAVVETVGKDLSSLSDEDAEKLVNDRLNDLRKGVTKLGLVNGGEGGEDMEDLTKVGVAAIKGRRKGAVSSIPRQFHTSSVFDTN